MAAAAVGLQLGLTIAEIKSGSEKAETIAGRKMCIRDRFQPEQAKGGQASVYYQLLQY